MDPEPGPRAFAGGEAPQQGWVHQAELPQRAATLRLSSGGNRGPPLGGRRTFDGRELLNRRGAGARTTTHTGKGARLTLGSILLRPGPSRGCGAAEAKLLHFNQKDGPEAAQATQRACSQEVAFFFSLRFYLFIHERHRERSRDPGRGRSRLPTGSPMWDSIPGPQNHDLSPRQMLNC